MTHAFAPIQAYWQQRNARERTLLTACAVVVGLAAIYLIAEPIARDRARLQRSLPALRADAARFARDLAQAALRQISPPLPAPPACLPTRRTSPAATPSTASSAARTCHGLP
jgi:type II secretory pathway component PulM